MTKISIVLLACLMNCAVHGGMVVSSDRSELIKIFVGVLSGVDIIDRDLALVGGIVQKDLQFSGQFAVDLGAIRPLSAKKSKKIFKRLFSRGYFFSVLIKPHVNGGIEWCLVDNVNGKIIDAKKVTTAGLVRGCAHAIADQVWPLLTGRPGCFSTKISFCAATFTKDGVQQQLFVADYDGSHRQSLAKLHGAAITPRWSKNRKRPEVFFSLYTLVNVQLVAVGMDGKIAIVSNEDGITMLPCFSPTNQEVVYCASGGSEFCQLWHYSTNGLKQLTYTGNNIAPVFGPSNVLYFCSDAPTGTPTIHSYDLATGRIERIVKTGYAVSPDYCHVTNRLVYAKMVRRVMQIFIHDVGTDRHTQVTFDAIDKHECCWSSCGSYIMYIADDKKTARLACYNTITKTNKYVYNDDCSYGYPAWSILYDGYPVVREEYKQKEVRFCQTKSFLL
jgi:tol-pal system beta propeller repeat protein TolB